MLRDDQQTFPTANWNWVSESQMFDTLIKYTLVVLLSHVHYEKEFSHLIQKTPSRESHILYSDIHVCSHRYTVVRKLLFKILKGHFHNILV